MILDYILDNYGTCERGADCYFSRNGCRNPVNEWRGRACIYWQPVEGDSLEVILRVANG